MSKSKDNMRCFLLSLEHELRDYADGPTYDDQAEAAFSFMDDLADEIKRFLDDGKEEITAHEGSK